MLKGLYQLKDMNGKIIRVPVNGEMLKRYYSRENFELYVIIRPKFNFLYETRVWFLI